MLSTSKFLLLALSVILAGCFRMNYRLAEEPAAASQIYSSEVWNSYFILGLVPLKKSLTADSLCQYRNIIEVQSQQTPENVLATVLGAGLYNAASVDVTCSR